MRLIVALLVLPLLVLTVVAQERPRGPVYEVPADATFTIEDVSVTRFVRMGKEEAISFEIAACLRVPKTAPTKLGHPAVLFISGSGSQTKHGFQGPLDAGTWELLDSIASSGFVVMSADDRGIGGTPLGEEGVDPLKIGYDALVGDARACLSYLRELPYVNQQRVFIIGHSEGGLTAAILGAEFECAGVVFMASMGRNMYDITFEQVENAAAAQPKAQREANLKAQREFQDAVKEDREPDFNILGAGAAASLRITWNTQVKPIRSWWREHFIKDVPAIMGALACPCFVTHGKADFQVFVDKDAKQIVANLMAGKCSDLTFKVYDDLDHLFKPCGGRPSTLEMYYEKRSLDVTFQADVVAWLSARRA